MYLRIKDPFFLSEHFMLNVLNTYGSGFQVGSTQRSLIGMMFLPSKAIPRGYRSVLGSMTITRSLEQTIEHIVIYARIVTLSDTKTATISVVCYLVVVYRV